MADLSVEEPPPVANKSTPIWELSAVHSAVEALKAMEKSVNGRD